MIIDEEQRFGVTHKEHLKKLRTEVDVLTLTATPIPRTLYMALTGVRDISHHQHAARRAPADHHPHRPVFAAAGAAGHPARAGARRAGVLRAQPRADHPRHGAATSTSWCRKRAWASATGRCTKMQLSQVMHQFTQAEIDVLLCTSIIESGLDIPNANTLIVDRGDTFGLAQLYQLRGRVGRGAQRAYAYFFRHRKSRPRRKARSAWR